MSFPRAFHRRVRGVFAASTPTLVALLVLLLLALAADAWWRPGLLQTLMSSLGIALLVLAVLTGVPLVALVYLVSALMVGHRLRPPERWWATIALALCAAFLWAVLHAPACDGGNCAAPVWSPGRVIEQVMLLDVQMLAAAVVVAMLLWASNYGRRRARARQQHRSSVSDGRDTAAGMPQAWPDGALGTAQGIRVGSGTAGVPRHW